MRSIDTSPTSSSAPTSESDGVACPGSIEVEAGSGDSGRAEASTAFSGMTTFAIRRAVGSVDVVAEFVAAGFGASPDDLVRLTVGYATSGTSTAALVHWMRHPDTGLDGNPAGAHGVVSASIADGRC
jgi:hypothetical protein